MPLVFAEELQKTCRVTLAVDKISGLKRSVEALGVKLDPTRVVAVQIMPAGYIAAKHNVFWSYYRSRRLKALARDADICISATNIIDFGKPAHHFITLLQGVDPAFDYSSPKEFGPPKTLTFRIKKILEDHVIRPIIGMRARAAIVHDNREHIYPNSIYVKNMMEKLYGRFQNTIFYPPTLLSSIDTVFTRKPLRIVYVGRITASKQIPDIIAIVELARSISKRNLELVIAGPYDAKAPFVRKIYKMIEKKNWVSLPGGVFGREKEELLLSGSFAVHARRDEEFGISVAEYIVSGLIVVVPNEGGSCEIINNPALTYDTNENAARILARLVLDDAFREEQRSNCANQAKLYTRESYFARQHELLSSIVDNS